MVTFSVVPSPKVSDRWSSRTAPYYASTVWPRTPAALAASIARSSTTSASALSSYRTRPTETS
ncbi:hypothetical protein GWK47_052612 [Chionoecetes opilio]|uniref:Uncharacterized protein n=1 Tax=Chionoecetes opilio TaxID=41210 RepID=A0A8J5C9U3_CHIOP|nr:hypothetical protein GWK47_052612 [Chionoecetes opilio]